jgi:hypothetical protein
MRRQINVRCKAKSGNRIKRLAAKKATAGLRLKAVRERQPGRECPYDELAPALEVPRDVNTPCR